MKCRSKPGRRQEAGARRRKGRGRGQGNRECVLYSPLMKTSTLTIRLSMEQRQALRRSAKALKKTESELIRDLLARDLDVRTLGERVGHLAGRSIPASEPLAQRILSGRQSGDTTGVQNQPQA